MIDIVALVIAVTAACGGCMKEVNECYKKRADQEQTQHQVVNNHYNHTNNDNNIEAIVMEEMKRQTHSSPRDIDIKINVHRHKEEREEK